MYMLQNPWREATRLEKDALGKLKSLGRGRKAPTHKIREPLPLLAQNFGQNGTPIE